MNIPDESGLLAALVLAPATYSRNRFFGLYARDGLMRIRRRASQLRGVVHAISEGMAHTVEPRAEGVCVRFTAPELGLRQTSFLSTFEIAVVDVAVARSKGLSAPLGADVAVRQALARLQGVSQTAEASLSDSGDDPRRRLPDIGRNQPSL